MTSDDPPGTRTLMRGGPFTARVRLCQVRPEELQATADPDIRFCPNCQQRVVDVRDVVGFIRAVSLGECVASRDADKSLYFGGPLIEYHAPGTLQWDE